jgi:hypothetical protein
MVLMTMRDDDTAHQVALVVEVLEVRDDVIDP